MKSDIFDSYEEEPLTETTLAPPPSGIFEILEPSKFILLMIAELQLDDKDDIGYLARGMTFLNSNFAAVRSLPLSNSEGASNTAKTHIKARLELKFYYDQALIKRLDPMDIPSVLADSDYKTNYVTGIGYALPIWNRDAIEAAVLERGLNLDTTDILMRAKVFCLSYAFAREKLKYGTFIKNANLFPEGFIAKLNSMRSRKLKTNERFRDLTSFFTTFFKSKTSYDYQPLMRELNRRLTTLNPVSNPDEYYEALKLLTSLRPSPDAKSLDYLSKVVYVSIYEKPLTNIKYTDKDFEYNYLNLSKITRLQDLVDTIVHTLRSLIPDGSPPIFILDPNRLANKFGPGLTIKRDNVVIDLVLSLMDNGVKVLVLTSPSSAPKISLNNLFFSSKYIIEFSSMTGFYLLTSRPVSRKRNGEMVQNHPMFGRQWVKYCSRMMVKVQGYCLRLFFSDPLEEMHARYELLLSSNEQGQALEVDLDNRKKTRGEDEEIYQPRIVSYQSIEQEEYVEDEGSSSSEDVDLIDVWDTIDITPHDDVITNESVLFSRKGKDDETLSLDSLSLLVSSELNSPGLEEAYAEAKTNETQVTVFTGKVIDFSEILESAANQDVSTMDEILCDLSAPDVFDYLGTAAYRKDFRLSHDLEDLLGDYHLLFSYLAPTALLDSFKNGEICYEDFTEEVLDNFFDYFDNYFKEKCNFPFSFSNMPWTFFSDFDWSVYFNEQASYPVHRNDSGFTFSDELSFFEYIQKSYFDGNGGEQARLDYLNEL